MPQHTFHSCVLDTLWYNSLLALVVQRLDNAIHWINYHLVDSSVHFLNSFLLDGDLSVRYHYPLFEQLGPEGYISLAECSQTSQVMVVGVNITKVNFLHKVKPN